MLGQTKLALEFIYKSTKFYFLCHPERRVRQTQDDTLFGVWSKANVLFYGTSRAPSPTEVDANIVLPTNLT